MRAASLLRRALTDKTNIYSLEWLDSLSAIFFDLHEKAIASSLSYRQIEELEDIAVYISNAYIDKLKEPGKAVAFWETFFFACIFPISKNKILSSFLNAHEKNGTLKHGCQAVWNYIEALLHLNNDENAYSAVLLVMVPEAMRIMLDFCILVDREIAIDYGKKFIDYVIDANTLKNLATVSVSLYEKLWIKSGHLYIEQILCNHQKEIQRTGDTSCPFSDLIYRNKKHNSFSTIFSSNKLTGDIITTLLLGEFTAIAFKIACALSSVGKAKEAERFLCDLHHNYTAAGFVSAAEGIIAYIKANTQKEFDDVCDKYCIYEI
jgi:hypothetical protein